jgi:hypothetical protein
MSTQRWLSTLLKLSPHQNRTQIPRSESAARTPAPDPAPPLSTGPARGSPVPFGQTSPLGPIPWAPDLRRLTPAAATALALDTDPDPGTDPHTPVTGTRTSRTSPCGQEEAPSRFPAWRQGAASPAQLTGAATTEVTAEAVAAGPAEGARTEAARGRGGNTEHHQSRTLSKLQSQSLHSRFCKQS